MLLGKKFHDIFGSALLCRTRSTKMTVVRYLEQSYNIHFAQWDKTKTEDGIFKEVSEWFLHTMCLHVKYALVRVSYQGPELSVC